MLIEYRGALVSGSIDIPDDEALPVLAELAQRALAHQPPNGHMAPPVQHVPRRRQVSSRTHLQTFIDAANRKIRLQLATGVEAELDVPEPSDRAAVRAMFEQLDAFGRDHDLTRGQVAGVGTRLSENFAVWRRPHPRSVR